MKYYELSYEERVKVADMIVKIIGTKEECTNDKMNCSERIKARAAYTKLFDKLADIWCKYGDKALALNYVDNGARKSGVTPKGMHWTFDMNNFGWTDRTHHCGTLYIEGQGCIFTSGTMARAFERILES